MASSSSSSIQKTESSNDKEMKPFKHFSHEHPLSLVQFQPHYNNENSDKEDENEDEDEDKDKDNDKDKDKDEDEDKYEDENFVVEEGVFGTCKMCEEEICSFHLCYYSCEKCDYTLHKFCAELPESYHNHPLHLDHNLTLSKQFKLDDPRYLMSSRTEENSKVNIADDEWICSICDISRKKFYNYHCSICEFNMDIICATMHEQKMEHPSHPHQLRRYLSRMITGCNACGDEHSGTFYHCTTCFSFRIHLDCALLPAKLLIQQSTNGSFSHSHSLTLKYSFPYIELKAKLFPRCIVCDKRFLFDKWHYRCDKCRYYVHVDCATSRKEAFMSSILMPAGVGKTYKNFKDDDLPNLIRCPFPDESINLLKHCLVNKGKSTIKREIEGKNFSHSHPLIFFETLHNGSVSLHDPMKRVELLCNGCVRPITDVPFYKCSQVDCGFVLHEWCTRLPSGIENHHGHPEHKLVLLPKVTGKLLGVFDCEICDLPCNGFTYGCKDCKYYMDISCGFIPNVISHEAHPNHLLKRLEYSPWESCKACRWFVHSGDFHCSICDFYLHMKCALLLPRKIMHRYDKHPLILRYSPVKNHSSEYYCEICEIEFDPVDWFYHCNPCASSIHTACAPVKGQCERSTYKYYSRRYDTIFRYINVKFGEAVNAIEHEHPLTFVQGIDADGQCNACDEELKRQMILKCFPCNFRIHYRCVNESATQP